MMPMPGRTCVNCGKLFTLLPNKPGLVSMCPQCSSPLVEIEVVERKPRQRRRKTANELMADAERKLRRVRRTTELIHQRKDQ
jgi:predicted  nucleic acid-binding Zn-ribbon protein